MSNPSIFAGFGGCQSFKNTITFLTYAVGMSALLVYSFYVSHRESVALVLFR
jgi:hypothetical protein